MTKLQKIRDTISSAAAMAMRTANGELSGVMDADELSAMGKGPEEGGDEHEQE